MPQLKYWDGTQYVPILGGVTDHGALGGLADDDILTQVQKMLNDDAQGNPA